MFIEFFFNLKAKGVPVSLHEWLTLHKALYMDLNSCNLTTFYYMARSILVKNETHFDRYDQAFLDSFGDIETTDELLSEILAGLKKVKELRLSEEEKRKLEELDLDRVIANFEEQLRQGHYKNHVGGNRAIGTGGRSTQGAWGYNPAGIRIGQGESRHKRAVQVAEKRSFRNYSSDRTLDIRQMKVALSHLRTLIPVEGSEELDLNETIDRTCRNAGEIELAWKKEKRRQARVTLIMDTGGSMNPYTEMVDRLFSAASSHIRHFTHYYFHNCIYQDLWTDMEQQTSVSTAEVLKKADPEEKLIIVGDAEMAPSELTWRNGSVDYWYFNEIPGFTWLQRVREAFPRSIWLNPLPKRTWGYIDSARMIQQVFPMYELTLEGLDDGVRKIMKKAV